MNRPRYQALLSVLLLLFTSAATHAKAHYPPQRLLAEGIRAIDISGVRGQVRVRGTSERHFELQVSHSDKTSDDWSLLVERRGSRLVLEVTHATLGREWRRHLTSERWPEFDIALSGPARPLRLGWREGDVSFERWNANVDASVLHGRLRVNGGSRDYRLQQLDGGLSVGDFNGTLVARAERGPITLTRVRGRLTLNWLSGQVNAREVRADARLEARALTGVITEGDGTWRVHVDSGELVFDGFRGDLGASGETTRWRLRRMDPRHAKIVSRAGRVDVVAPGNLPTWLASVRGAINSPYPVEAREGLRVAANARLAVGRARLIVRTESGAISLSH